MCLCVNIVALEQANMFIQMKQLCIILKIDTFTELQIKTAFERYNYEDKRASKFDNLKEIDKFP